MFWGLIMESGKRYTQTVERAFHVSMACLEPNTADNDNVSVMLAFDNREFILCNLNKHKAIQTQLDLNFQSGDKIAFMSSGRGRVHLTGYLLETDEDEDEDGEEDTNLEDSMEGADSFIKKTSNSVSKSSKRKTEPLLSKSENKKAKLEPESDEEKSSSSGEDTFNILGDSEDVTEDFSEDDDDVDDDDEDEDDDDEDEEDEEESEEEEAIDSSKQKKSPTKKPKQVIKSPNEIQSKIPNEKQKTPIEKKQKNKSLTEKQQKNKTPIEKQQKEKVANDKHQQVSTPKSSPGAQVNGMTVQQQSGKKNKGLNTSKGAKTPGSDSPQKKVIEGGVIIEDLRVGNGPVAKPGRQVSVFYVGRLKHNNKQFDSTSEGPGFKFRLGRGEVIKGWDIGVNGMKVGGKRKIVCPAPFAYGPKGSPPTIPPNSTLVFDVELKAVN